MNMNLLFCSNCLILCESFLKLYAFGSSFLSDDIILFNATISLITLFLVFTELFIIQSLILCNKTCHPYAISVTGRPSVCKDRPIAGIGKPTDSTIFLKNEVRRIKRRGFCIRAADGKHHTIAQADLRQMVSQHNINNTLFIINIKSGMALA